MAGIGGILGMIQEAEEKDVRPIPEVQVTTLREAFARYRKKRFQPGDIITPLNGFGAKHTGSPYIVLEAKEPVYTVRDEPTSVGVTGYNSRWGLRLDIRVMGFSTDGTINKYWCESDEWGIYDPNKATEPHPSAVDVHDQQRQGAPSVEDEFVPQREDYLP